MELATGLAALLGAYLFVGFYLSVAPPIRRIVATLHAVAGGDLTQRVAVDTRDELSFVARALNETVARTEAATNRLAQQATHDTLTGLPNRALALDRLGQALSRGRPDGGLLAVLFIDLDRFKPINDSLGHHSGDEVLTEIGRRLTAVSRGADTVARLAGDEFVVIRGLRRPGRRGGDGGAGGGGAEPADPGQHRPRGHRDGRHRRGPETLRAIAALGVHLALDDFGTGYSSLTYLRRFPVEALKIDRSFVAGLGHDREDEAIVEMILNLSRALGLRVVAEGVETVEQLAQLRRWGSPLMQGFYFGRPMPAEQVEEFLGAAQPVLS